MTRATQTSTQMTARWIFPLPTKLHASLLRYLFAPFVGMLALQTDGRHLPVQAESRGKHNSSAGRETFYG